MITRIFDLFVSGLSIIFLFPLFFAIAIWIKIDSNGPIFFRQLRVGFNGKPFYIYKFRTMVSDAEHRGRQITSNNDSRITKCGATLRKYKLDELPQLMNVFCGEMGLVGPRPEVPRYVDLMKEKYAYLLSVRPGMTDPASLKFKNESELLDGKDDSEAYYLAHILPEKVSVSSSYLAKRTFFSDLYVIFLTVKAIIC